MRLSDSYIQQLIDDNGGNFAPSEFGDKRGYISKDLYEQITLFRNWHGFPTLVSSAFRDNSTAHKGFAVDQFIFTDYAKAQPKPMHLWRLATAWQWSGVGIYFDKHAFGEPAIMLHLDILNNGTRGKQRPLRWVHNEKGYYYQSLETGNFWNSDIEKSTTLEKEIKNFLS